MIDIKRIKLSEKRIRVSDSDKSRKKNNDSRNCFESDLGRVLFCPAVRRMHDKTQVVPLTTDDNIHSRLTHSMEVMSIANSIGLNICRTNSKSTDEDLIWKWTAILKTAGLVHDIGNPPFGHFGESVISKYFTELFENNDKMAQLGIIKSNENQLELTENEKYDFTQFDGNAQGFRVLTKLQYSQDLCGLNLTTSSLAAFLKYPNYTSKDKKSGNIYAKKHGVFTSEQLLLEKIAFSCDIKIGDDKFKRHPFAFLVEAADSICYMIMDIEDGQAKKWYKIEDLVELIDNAKFSEIWKTVDSKNLTYQMKSISLRTALIQYFVSLTTENFINNIDDIIDGNYNQELINDDDNNLAEALNSFCVNNIFSKREIVSMELVGNSVLTNLLDKFI